MKRLTLAAIGCCLVAFARPAAAFSSAPTYLYRSGLVSSDASADVNISLHKAVISGAIAYDGGENPTEHPENAFDGDDNTTTGLAGNMQNLAWINDAKPVDDRKLPAQPARFLSFHFHPPH